MPDNVQLAETPEELRINENEEIQQILGSAPGWILRWGITIVFFTVLVLLGISYLIKYPDIISAQVLLTTEKPPIRVISMNSGKLEKLMVSDQEEVKENQLIALLENPAKYRDILKLERYINQIDFDNSVLPPKNLKLGSLQNLYSNLSQHLKDYQYYTAQVIVVQKTNAIRKEIENIKALNISLQKQNQTLAQEVEISKKNLDRNKLLFKDGSVSALEVERAETAYLQYKRQLEGTNTNIINNDIRINQLELQILEMNQVQGDNTVGKTQVLEEDVQLLKNEIETWKLSYTIKAPISGKVSFSKIWSAKQFIRSGDEVMTIVPKEGTGEVFGKATLPLAGSGKVKTGMIANIQLLSYPHQEFGTIRSTVRNISLIPDVDQEIGKIYQVELMLIDSLTTSYGKQIPFKQEMIGTANIITEDRRILDRIFDKVLDAVKNR